MKPMGWGCSFRTRSEWNYPAKPRRQRPPALQVHTPAEVR